MATISDLHLREYEPQNLVWRGRYIHNWFSNFDKIGRPVEYRGRTTPILEVAYVAAKNPDMPVSDPRDPSGLKQISFIDRVFACATPGEAKRLGAPPYRGGILTAQPGWDEMSLAAMDFFLRQRWQLGTHGAERLAMVDYPLVEANNWGDTRFGATIKDWRGRNALGLLLFVIAQEIREGEVALGAPEASWRSHQEVLVQYLNTLDHGRIVVPAPDSTIIPKSPQMSLF